MLHVPAAVLRKHFTDLRKKSVWFVGAGQLFIRFLVHGRRAMRMQF